MELQGEMKGEVEVVKKAKERIATSKMKSTAEKSGKREEKREEEDHGEKQKNLNKRYL